MEAGPFHVEISRALGNVEGRMLGIEHEIKESRKEHKEGMKKIEAIAASFNKTLKEHAEADDRRLKPLENWKTKVLGGVAVVVSFVMFFGPVIRDAVASVLSK